jgi:hypothetical protein
VKEFTVHHNKNECHVEYFAAEDAKKALNANVGFKIDVASPRTKKSYEGMIDPDVQSELECMLPIGAKTFASRQGIEFIIAYKRYFTSN